MKNGPHNRCVARLELRYYQMLLLGGGPAGGGQAHVYGLQKGAD